MIERINNDITKSSRFRTKNWVEINDDVREMYNTNSQGKFKTVLLKSGRCDYSDAYILVKETIAVAGREAVTAEIAADRNDKQIIFKDYAAFIDCIKERNNTQVQMPMILIL